MNSPRSAIIRSALGVVTLLPLVSLACALFALVVHSSYDFSWVLQAFLWSSLAGGLVALYYLALVLTGSRTALEKLGWIAAFAYALAIASIAYWIVNVRKEQSPDPSTTYSR